MISRNCQTCGFHAVLESKAPHINRCMRLIAYRGGRRGTNVPCETETDSVPHPQYDAPKCGPERRYWEKQ